MPSRSSQPSKADLLDQIRKSRLSKTQLAALSCVGNGKPPVDSRLPLKTVEAQAMERISKWPKARLVQLVEAGPAKTSTRAVKMIGGGRNQVAPRSAEEFFEDVNAEAKKSHRQYVGLPRDPMYNNWTTSLDLNNKSPKMPPANRVSPNGVPPAPEPSTSWHKTEEAPKHKTR